MNYSNHHLYIQIDLNSKDALKNAREIILQAFEGHIPFEGDRIVYDLEGKVVGYIGTERRDRAQLQAEADYHRERERSATLKAENKGLRELIKEATASPDERVTAMQAKLDKIEGLASQLMTALR
jgi:hypothetical protein